MLGYLSLERTLQGFSGRKLKALPLLTSLVILVHLFPLNMATAVRHTGMISVLNSTWEVIVVRMPQVSAE